MGEADKQLEDRVDRLILAAGEASLGLKAVIISLYTIRNLLSNPQAMRDFSELNKEIEKISDHASKLWAYLDTMHKERGWR